MPALRWNGKGWSNAARVWNFGFSKRLCETLVLPSRRRRAILVALDILVDIGVLAEKEVIQ
jgi:hypothetical protein